MLFLILMMVVKLQKDAQILMRRFSSMYQVGEQFPLMVQTTSKEHRLIQPTTEMNLMGTVMKTMTMMLRHKLGKADTID